MGNTSSRPLNPREPRAIYHDLGYGDIISNPLVAPAAEAPKLKGRRTLSFAITRRSTAQSSRRVLGYPPKYHW
ncbi:hypothetical protein KVR01_004381 [Diaporthe batatas]|uniref:uncharacterized protein n=1 Tax=Diaporthe batatas TaxID=748121 RepID=UPI001D0551F9|nr:uncharacterized protein KVR01_004381 [Diaporthe batatas]KAG8165829.1 hypothetical protein KVR01_004381 [Diaporthe batatas]